MLDKLGQTTEAAREYRLASALNHPSSTALNNLARLQGSWDDIPSAVRSTHIAIHADPSDVDSWRNLGALQKLSEHLNEAQNAYETAVKIEPGLVDLHLAVSEMAQDAGDLKSAEKHLKDAISCDPQNTHVRIKLDVVNHMILKRKLKDVLKREDDGVVSEKHYVHLDNKVKRASLKQHKVKQNDQQLNILKRNDLGQNELDPNNVKRNDL
eukprot:gnl/MRDRNA2_/MRDRNA2_220135_c0_seq1.p1 gnl/MRDRNA2_/MRDRNA2_220135_c0~~gnl/MRDRNA2_/MRDRNA2_220135_c0_seq1.p1  ORF type:complete len:211 (+),score=26.85 gnl/MRDRNA2_/MRDRNA2_220135_c0_seq1:615-1247(+)